MFSSAWNFSSDSPSLLHSISIILCFHSIRLSTFFSITGLKGFQTYLRKHQIYHCKVNIKLNTTMFWFIGQATIAGFVLWHENNCTYSQNTFWASVSASIWFWSSVACSISYTQQLLQMQLFFLLYNSIQSIFLKKRTHSMSMQVHVIFYWLLELASKGIRACNIIHCCECVLRSFQPPYWKRALHLLPQD